MTILFCLLQLFLTGETKSDVSQ